MIFANTGNCGTNDTLPTVCDNMPKMLRPSKVELSEDKDL